MLGGVCVGLAQRFELNVTIVRLAFVVGTLIGGPGLLIYLILWVAKRYRRDSARTARAPNEPAFLRRKALTATRSP